MDDFDWGGVFDAIDGAGLEDLSSLWSPANLRADSGWQFSMPDFNLSDINLDNLDARTVSNILNEHDLSNLADTSQLGSIDLGDQTVSNIINDTTHHDSTFAQANPYVQTYLHDPIFGDNAASMSSPVGSQIGEPSTHSGYFSTNPSNYYGLSNPNLSDAVRSKLYEGINFATEGGVKMFARRLAAATNDTVSLQTPDGGTVTAKPDGKVTKTAAPAGHAAASSSAQGSSGAGGGTGGGAGGGAGGAGGGGGINPLAAMGILGGLAAMLTTDGSQQGTHAPIKTVNDIPASNTGLNIRGRGEVPYGQAGMEYGVNPTLARNLGAPMRQGGLLSSINPAILAHGGRTDYSHGAPVNGEGSGQDDKIPALLSDGEYVIDADTVAALGDGSNKEGAKLLDSFREHIRAHKRSAPAHKIPPKAKSPLQYMKEAKNA
jgi:hypothetical protein